MREFDHEGLLLAEFQGKLFERSTELDCSTPIFMRRFLHSDLLRFMDKNRSISLSMDVDEAIQSIQDQFGESNYGKEKYSKAAMFWIGYFYRYLSYTRDLSTSLAMHLFPYRQLNKVFYSFHTQDLEWCVRSLLELNHLSEDVLDKRQRLKAIIAAHERNRLV